MALLYRFLLRVLAGVGLRPRSKWHAPNAGWNRERPCYAVGTSDAGGGASYRGWSSVPGEPRQRNSSDTGGAGGGVSDHKGDGDNGEYDNRSGAPVKQGGELPDKARLAAAKAHLKETIKESEDRLASVANRIFNVAR
jgi:hypothetical protein